VSDTLDEPAVAVAVPPQPLLKPFGVATASPEGSKSVKATPVNVTFQFGLLIVKLRLVVPFIGTIAAPKLLLMVGGTATVRFAEAILPVPPFVDVTPPPGTTAPVVFV